MQGSRRILAWGMGCLLVAAPAFAQERPDQAQLEVGWISREPSLPPPPNVQAPIEEGWPEVGRTVYWMAHVLNRGTQAVAAVPYAWRVDDETVARGKLDLVPGDNRVRLPWGWTLRRHLISFEIQPPPEAGDATPGDNRLTVASNALGLGLWVEQGLYNWMREGGRPGFERWAQAEIDRWNTILARAVYPTSPQGALDRIRLERVVILPDGQRPRNEELDTDLSWLFRNEVSVERFLHVGAPDSVVLDQTIVLHELLHQRGLTDLYAYHVYDAPLNGNDVNILENGMRVAGTFLMPPLVSGSIGIQVYRFPVDDLMGTRYRAGANLTEHCANGLNLWAGRRTPIHLDQFGNVINELASVPQPASYLYRLPKRTEIRLVDEAGSTISGATVDVYADHNVETYRKTYGPTPDRVLATDGRGVFVLPGNLLDGLPPTTMSPKSQVIILGVRNGRGRGYVFVPVYDLNLLYFRQGPESAQTALTVKLHPW